MAKDYMPKPCPRCPYRRDVTPYLHPERAEELAYICQNPYSSFYCHETTESDDDSEDGEMLVVETTKICAGFLSLQHHELESTWYDDEGFTASEDVYWDVYAMIEAYEYEWEKTHD